MDEMTTDALGALRHREADDCSIISMPKMSFWNKPNKEKTLAEQQHIIDRAQTLQAGINLPFDVKLRHAKKVIQQSVDSNAAWALSYSGGGDSTALSHLMVNEIGIDIPHVMSNTRMEYPETIKMANRWFKQLRAIGIECTTVYPARRPKDLWKEIGVPLWSKQIAYKYRKFAASKSDKIPSHVPKDLHDKFRLGKAKGLKITEKCCDYLKKKPMKKWDKEQGITGHFTGVRCAESRNRRLAWITRGALYQAVSHANLWISNPLAFWTQEEVDAYLADNGIEILRPDTPHGGSGCVTCMFGCDSRAKEGNPNAMQDLKTRNPRIWETALDDWGYREVLEEMGVPYE